MPSRLFIYYNEHVMEQSIDADTGAQIRDKPPVPCYKTALHYKAVRYMRLAWVINQMKGCFASCYPFVFGLSVYESFKGEEQHGQYARFERETARRLCRARRRL